VDVDTTAAPTTEDDGTAAAAAAADRHYVVALWGPTKNPFVAKLEPSLQKIATTAEEEADEAICLVMEDDGTLTVHASKHSVPKALLSLGVKLAIVWPLGLAGAVGIATAAFEIEAATRKRTREGLTEDDLRLMVGKMKPGWCAFIACYHEALVPAAVQSCVSLGAAIVWDGNGSTIERMIDETDLEEGYLEKEEGNVKVYGSFGTGGGSVHNIRTSMEKPEDKAARVYRSCTIAGLAKQACLLCTCIVTQVANFFL